MSKILKITLLIVVTFLAFNCSSSDDANNRGYIGTIIDEEFRIRNSGIVNYDLGDLGESGISSIIVNPKNFSVNRLTKTQYTYEPADNYVGKDYVEIEISIVNINNSTGNVQKKIYKIRITIIVTE